MGAAGRLAALALFAVDGLEDAAVIDIDFVVIAVENFLDSIPELMGDGFEFSPDISNVAIENKCNPNRGHHAL